MREIKFRGKRVDTGVWVYGYLVKTHNGQCYIIKEPAFIPGLTMQSEKFIEVIPKTIGQFTGLKDKNDVGIYEGDILKWTDRGSDFPNILRKVEPVVIKNLNSMSPMIFSKGCFDKPDEDWYEVIGNIYENPELLK